MMGKLSAPLRRGVGLRLKQTVPLTIGEAHKLKLPQFGCESVPDVEIVHVRPTVQLEMLHCRQVRVFFNQSNELVAETCATMGLTNEHIEYESLERVVGQHSGEANQVVLRIDQPNADL